MPEAHATFPNKFEAFYLIAVLIAVELLISLALRESSLLDSMDWQGASGFITVVANGLAFIFLLTYKQLTYRSLFHATKHSAVRTVAALLIPLALIVPALVLVTGALNSLMEWMFPMSLDDQEMFSEMVATSAIPLFFACIAAPLLEEMLFRGVILRSFLQQYSRTESILWTSLLFALAHLHVYQFFTALVLGIVLGWLYERTRSLWPSILLHAAFNGFVALGASHTMAGIDYSVTWLLAAAFIGAIAGGALLLRVLEPPAAHPQKSNDA
jgi:membrane protease YdiL (CAAX protease family)